MSYSEEEFILEGMIKCESVDLFLRDSEDEDRHVLFLDEAHHVSDIEIEDDRSVDTLNSSHEDDESVFFQPSRKRVRRSDSSNGSDNSFMKLRRLASFDEINFKPSKTLSFVSPLSSSSPSVTNNKKRKQSIAFDEPEFGADDYQSDVEFPIDE